VKCVNYFATIDDFATININIINRTYETLETLAVFVTAEVLHKVLRRSYVLLELLTEIEAIARVECLKGGGGGGRWCRWWWWVWWWVWWWWR
jgi:hypothetical protein